MTSRSIICLILLTGFYHTIIFSQNNTEPIKSPIGSFGFIENKGQIHDQHNQFNNDVKFLLSNAGFNVQLRTNGFSYDTYIVENNTRRSSIEDRHANKVKTPSPTKIKFHRVDIILLNANPAYKIIAEEKSNDYLIYFTDRSQNGIISYHYQRIVYKEIYPHIDLVFDARNSKNEKSFEYYFIVQPNGDAKSIKVQYRGANTTIENKSINIKLSHNKLTEKIPASFVVSSDKQIDFKELSNEKKVKVNYRNFGNNTYGFVAPFYDKSKTLIIDPTPDLVWGTYYGDWLNDWSHGIAKDNNGDLIFAGGSDNSMNIATTGSYQSTFGGFSDAVIGKFQPNGTRLWVSYYGGDQSDVAFTVTTDANNNILFGGHTYSTTGIATPGAHQPVKALGNDVYFVKFNSAGFRIWGTYYGGEDGEQLHSIKADPNGNIYVAGWTHSTTGFSTPGSYQPNYGGGVANDAGDGFLAKFNASGVRQWGTFYGGISFDRFYDMDIDNSGNIYATGIAYSTTNIATPGTFQPNYAGGVSDAFLVKFDNNGNRQWATYFGNSALEYAYGLIVDNQGDVIIGGLTMSQSGLTSPGCHQPNWGGDFFDGFIAKFNPGGARIWSTYYGGNGQEEIRGIATDINNNIYFTGWSFSTTNIATPNSYQPTGGGLGGVWTPFFVKLNSSGARQWGTYYGYGGTYGQGIGEDMVVDNNGNVFVTGETTNTNGISTCGAIQPNLASSNFDIFLGEFSETLTAAPAVSIITSTTGSVCAGSPVNFIATPVNAGTSFVFQWKVNGVNAGSNSPNFTSSTLNNGDVVTCLLTIAASACNPAGTTVTSNLITVSLITPVTPTITISSTSTTICTANSVTFTALSTNGGNSPVYQWKINGLNVGTNSQTFATSSLNNGDVITCSLTSSITCTTLPTASSNQIQMTVNAVPVPTITITSSANNICPNELINLSASATNIPSNVNYQWRVNGTNTGTNTNSFSSNNFSNGDIITCVISGTVPGCTDQFTIPSNSISVSVKVAPTIHVTPIDTIIFWGDSIQLSATVTGNIINYTWIPHTGLNNPFSLNPVVKPLDNTNYTLKVTDVNGCQDEQVIKISVMKDFFMPNAFTPNNDGLNDVFRIPPGIYFSLERYSVFDRWGNEIFKTKDISKGWDGTYHGVLSPIGVYVYLIKGKSTKGNVFIKGTVTLIR